MRSQIEGLPAGFHADRAADMIAPKLCDTEKRCEIVTEFGRLEQLSADWLRLWNASARREIFQDFGWIRAFWKTYGQNMCVCSPVVFEGRKVCGILPLAVQRHTLQFLGAPGSDYNDILCEEHGAADVLRIALEGVLYLRGAWKTCILANLSSQSLIIRHLQDLPNHLKKRLNLMFGCSCPTIVLGENPASVLAPLLRKESLRRHSNQLQELGQLVFRHLENRADIRQHLIKFFKQHIERWAMIGRSSHFLQPESRHFYAALVEELDPSRQLRFGVLELDGQPIAYHFGFELDGKFIWYQSAFNVDYWECSPGEVLLGELLRYARENGLREFDFTVGGEAYKSRFANQFRENFIVYLHSPSNRIWSRLDHAVREVQKSFRRIKQGLEQRPRTRRAIKRNALRVSTLLGRAHHLLKREGLLRLSLRAATVARNSIWARDDLLFFSPTKQLQRTEAGQWESHNFDLRIAKATLGDLAVLSLENPGFLDRTKLGEYRTRLRDGDQVYIGLQGTSIAVVAWLGARTEIASLDFCARCRAPLNSPALMIYDCRLAPNLREHRFRDEMLSALAWEAAVQGIDAFTHSSLLSGTSRTSIERVGFRLSHRMTHRRVFHWVHHGWISQTVDPLSGRSR
jgi:CelD/BcsL family acetyltransferase involved in cellulose biosynthesis